MKVPHQIYSSPRLTSVVIYLSKWRHFLLISVAILMTSSYNFPPGDVFPVKELISTVQGLIIFKFLLFIASLFFLYFFSFIGGLFIAVFYPE